MERKKAPGSKLSTQMKRKAETPKIKENNRPEGDTSVMTSTGSTLLDLAISGTRVRGGGLPGGILVEIFGPSSLGKTVLLCEIAGSVQRKDGEVMFFDPEGRLNKEFAQIFDLDVAEVAYSMPDTVTELFGEVRKWEPEGKAKTVHGIFADSLAALSTDMEMTKDEGDKMGGRRAKEFSEQLRKTCRFLTQKNLLMVCSNQIRQNMDAGPFGQKYDSPGGEAFKFYPSLRLRISATKGSKIEAKTKVAGKEIKRIIGINSTLTVFKSSVDKPFRTAPISIIFDYGIDDIRQNLQFIKDHTTAKSYTLGGEVLSNSMDTAIRKIERGGLEDQLREEVIDLWEFVESNFESDRKEKKR